MLLQPSPVVQALSSSSIASFETALYTHASSPSKSVLFILQTSSVFGWINNQTLS